MVPLMVCINGSPRLHSRTAALTDAVAQAIVERISIERRDIPLSLFGHEILSGLTRDRISAAGEDVCRVVQHADLLIVASPVYRASYTGILKHLFDLVDKDVMRGRSAVLVATGGTPLHGLVMEHQFRPLMGFFGIHTAPTTVYGLEADFTGQYEVSSLYLKERLARAADEAVDLLRSRRHKSDHSESLVAIPSI